MAADDEFIEKIRAALSLGSGASLYSTTREDPVVSFLKEHKGKRVYTISH